MRLVIDFTRAAAGDNPQLLAALEAEQARNHALVEHIGKIESALNEQNEWLRTRTIERDHAREDGHLWSLCLAYLVDQEGDDQLGLPADDVNAMTGRMLDAKVEHGYVFLRITDRPAASEEGRNG